MSADENGEETEEKTYCKLWDEGQDSRNGASYVVEDEGKPMCVMCEADSQAPAVMFCSKCEILYCKECRSRYHPDKKPLQAHKLVSIREYLTQQKPQQRLQTSNGTKMPTTIKRIAWEVTPPPTGFMLNKLLLYLSKELLTEDIEGVKCLMQGHGGITSADAEEITDAHQLFRILRKYSFLTMNNIVPLQTLIWFTARKDLYNKMVDFVCKNADIIHICTPPEPENGRKNVKIHVNRDISRDFVEEIRSGAARWLCIPDRFIIVSGLEPTGSCFVTLMIPTVGIKRLKEVFTLHKDWLLQRHVDRVELCGHVFHFTDADKTEGPDISPVLVIACRTCSHIYIPDDEYAYVCPKCEKPGGLSYWVRSPDGPASIRENILGAIDTYKNINEEIGHMDQSELQILMRGCRDSFTFTLNNDTELVVAALSQNNKLLLREIVWFTKRTDLYEQMVDLQIAIRGVTPIRDVFNTKTTEYEGVTISTSAKLNQDIIEDLRSAFSRWLFIPVYTIQTQVTQPRKLILEIPKGFVSRLAEALELHSEWLKQQGVHIDDKPRVPMVSKSDGMAEDEPKPKYTFLRKRAVHLTRYSSESAVPMVSKSDGMAEDEPEQNYEILRKRAGRSIRYSSESAVPMVSKSDGMAEDEPEQNYEILRKRAGRSIRYSSESAVPMVSKSDGMAEDEPEQNYEILRKRAGRSIRYSSESAAGPSNTLPIRRIRRRVAEPVSRSSVILQEQNYKRMTESFDNLDIGSSAEVTSLKDAKGQQPVLENLEILQEQTYKRMTELFDNLDIGSSTEVTSLKDAKGQLPVLENLAILQERTYKRMTELVDNLDIGSSTEVTSLKDAKGQLPVLENLAILQEQTYKRMTELLDNLDIGSSREITSLKDAKGQLPVLENLAILQEQTYKLAEWLDNLDVGSSREVTSLKDDKGQLPVLENLAILQEETYKLAEWLDNLDVGSSREVTSLKDAKGPVVSKSDGMGEDEPNYKRFTELFDKLDFRSRRGVISLREANGPEIRFTKTSQPHMKIRANGLKVVFENLTETNNHAEALTDGTFNEGKFYWVLNVFIKYESPDSVCRALVGVVQEGSDLWTAPGRKSWCIDMEYHPDRFIALSPHGATTEPGYRDWLSYAGSHDICVVLDCGTKTLNFIDMSQKEVMLCHNVNMSKPLTPAIRFECTSGKILATASLALSHKLQA